MEEGVNKTMRESIIKLYKKAKMQPENITNVLEVKIDFIRSVLKEEGIYTEVVTNHL